MDIKTFLVYNAVAGDMSPLRVFFPIAAVTFFMSIAVFFMAKKTTTRKHDDFTMGSEEANEILYPEIFRTKYFTSNEPKKTLGGRTGWYPDAEGTKELYMDHGVSSGLERPYGYGKITDSEEVRPDGENPKNNTSETEEKENPEKG